MRAFPYLLAHYGLITVIDEIGWAFHYLIKLKVVSSIHAEARSYNDVYQELMVPRVEGKKCFSNGVLGYIPHKTVIDDVSPWAQGGM
jgi:hypothetical protein